MTITTRIRAALGATLAIGMLVAAPTAALAAPPERETISFGGSIEIPDFAGCGVTVLLEEQGEAQATRFRAEDGSLEREQVRFTGTITLTSEHGQITDSYRYNGTLDASTGIVVERGRFGQAQGSTGLVEKLAGRLVFDISTGARLDFTGVDTFADGDFSALCEELAG